jgi:hypothetical protein
LDKAAKSFEGGRAHFTVFGHRTGAGGAIDRPLDQARAAGAPVPKQCVVKGGGGPGITHLVEDAATAGGAGAARGRRQHIIEIMPVDGGSLRDAQLVGAFIEFTGWQYAGLDGTADVSGMMPEDAELVGSSFLPPSAANISRSVRRSASVIPGRVSTAPCHFGQTPFCRFNTSPR